MDRGWRDIRREYQRKWVSNKRRKRGKVCNPQDLYDDSDNEESDNNGSFPSNDIGESIMPISETIGYARDIKKRHRLNDVNDGTAAITMDMESNLSVILNSKNYASLCDQTNMSLDDVWKSIDEHETLSESDSDYSSDDSDEKNEKLTSAVSTWINEFQVKHNAADRILKIKRNEGGHKQLPSSTRTLLQSEKTAVHLEEKSGMQYKFFGFAQSLQKHIMKCPLNIESIVLYLNIDGLPLFRSSKTSMWPVLCATSLGQQKIIFPDALCCGTGKPTNQNFLLGTIHELKDFLHAGLHVANRIIRVNLGAVVCDAPAIAMVKAIKLCSGYWGCDHCEQKGKWSKKVCYTQVEHLQLRNDESFRHQSQAKHHKGVSPFTILPIDMITAFPMDYMHQACLGVMKRLILCWLLGEKKKTVCATNSGGWHKTHFSKKLYPTCLRSQTSSHQRHWFLESDGASPVSFIYWENCNAWRVEQAAIRQFLGSKCCHDNTCFSKSRTTIWILCPSAPALFCRAGASDLWAWINGL